MSDAPSSDSVAPALDVRCETPHRSHAVRNRLLGFAKTKLGLAVYSTLGVFCIYVLSLLLLTQFAAPRLLSTLTAIAEKVVVRVANPVQSAFVVANAAMFTGDAKSATCVSGLVRPVQHSTVGYTRIGEGRVFIEVTPPGDREDEVSLTLVGAASQNSTGATDGETKGYVTFVVPTDKPEKDAKEDPTACPNAEPLVRLPIYGSLSLGEEQHAPSRPNPLEPSLLHSGSLEVSARAIVLLGLMRPTTYPVATISIPVGSRFEAKKSPSEAPAFWWGFVGVRKDQPALSVVTATEAPAFSIYRPGVSEPVDVEVGVLAQVFNDPNLARIQVLLAVFLLILNLAISLFGIAPWGSKDDPFAVAEGETEEAAPK